MATPAPPWMMAVFVSPIGVIAYLLGHFVVYGLALRSRPSFRQERVIFRFHFLSWLAAVPLAALLGFSFGGLEQAGLLGLLMASVHGIYSLSFLELWSLTQGSYSLSILEDIAAGRESRDKEVAPEQLAEIGRQKRAARQLALQDMGLIDSAGSVTRRGALIAGGIATIITLTKGRNLNH